MDEKAQAALREPFPSAAIGKLPRGGIQLDFVGHAAVTDRLLKVDPEWSWEPFALDSDGAPLIRYGNKIATMWIELTVCGVTRIECGSVEVGHMDIEKELVSDALRRAAMRFGVALDLWSKEDLHWSEDAQARAGEARTGDGEGTTSGTSHPVSRGDTSPARSSKAAPLATEAQAREINRQVDRTGCVPTPWPLEEGLTKAEASKILDWLKSEPAEPPAVRVASLRKDADQAAADFVDK